MEEFKVSFLSELEDQRVGWVALSVADTPRLVVM